MKEILLGALFVSIIIISGCTSTPEDMAMTSPVVQRFLTDYPNAELKITHFTANESQSILGDVRSACDKASVEAKEFYKINITDASGTHVIAWIDWSSKVIECAIRYAANGSVVPQPATPPIQNAQCSALLQEITAATIQVNYCSQDSDCTTANVFRCYCTQFVNRNADLSVITAKESQFDSLGCTCSAADCFPEVMPAKCVGGKCVKSQVSATCVDTDGGQNYYQKGQLQNVCPGSTCGIYIDQCMNTTTLVEYTCDNTGVELYTCPGGCSDGACVRVQQSCTDSDGGQAYYVKGTVIPPCCTDPGCGPCITSQTDSCLNATTLVEYSCTNYTDGITYACPNGCSEGACNA